MRDKLPNRIKVGPFHYTVREDDEYPQERALAENLIGFQDPSHHVIWLRPDQSAGSAKDTLLHEVIHAILALTLKHNEGTVLALTTPLLEVLRDNPDLVAFLTEGSI